MARTIEQLRKEVLAANIEIFRRGLAQFTFGNVSGFDRERGVVVIKPSGVPYAKLTAKMLVACDLNGKVARGALRPSSDLPTHLVLYRAFAGVNAIVHTHSPHATAWAQAGREIPCFGTTHADHFHGSVPVTDAMTAREISGDYVAKEKVKWLGDWMRTAKPGDVVYLNDDHESVPKEHADVAIECDDV